MTACGRAKKPAQPKSADHGTERTAAAPIIPICIRHGLPRHAHAAEQNGGHARGLPNLVCYLA